MLGLLTYLFTIQRARLGGKQNNNLYMHTILRSTTCGKWVENHGELVPFPRGSTDVGHVTNDNNEPLTVVYYSH